MANEIVIVLTNVVRNPRGGADVYFDAIDASTKAVFASQRFDGSDLVDIYKRAQNWRETLKALPDAAWIEKLASRTGDVIDLDAEIGPIVPSDGGGAK